MSPTLPGSWKGCLGAQNCWRLVRRREAGEVSATVELSEVLKQSGTRSRVRPNCGLQGPTRLTQARPQVPRLLPVQFPEPSVVLFRAPPQVILALDFSSQASVNSLSRPLLGGWCVPSRV